MTTKKKINIEDFLSKKGAKQFSELGDVETKKIKKMLSKMIGLINFVYNTIPKGSVSQKKLIESFEVIDKKAKKMGVHLFKLSSFMYSSKHPKFERFNKYFKKVHGIIRKKAVQSPYFMVNLEAVVMNNFKDDTGVFFTKKEGIQAYNKTLDEYDPNKKQSKRKKSFHWNGFWSLIGTKNGEISGVYLGDTADREYFYGHLKKIRK